jgi:hypothetical protein
MLHVYVPHGYNRPRHHIPLGHNIEHLLRVGDVFELVQREHELDVVVFIGVEPEEGRHPMVDVEAGDEGGRGWNGGGAKACRRGRCGAVMRGGGSHRGARATGTKMRRHGKARGVAVRVFTRTWRRERNFWSWRKRLEVSGNVETGDT